MSPACQTDGTGQEKACVKNSNPYDAQEFLFHETSRLNKPVMGNEMTHEENTHYMYIT